MALTDEDKVFINYLEQTYISTGSLPSQAKCKESGFGVSQWRRLLNSEDYYIQLCGRGIRKDLLDELRGRRDRKVLTEQQLTAVAVMVDLRDTRSQIKKLAEMGIATGTWDMWLRDPAFQNYIKTRGLNLVQDNAHEADFALMQKVRSGDVRAIAMYHELTGRAPVGGSKSSAPDFDIKSFLVKIMEILQVRVKDQDVLQLIANDLLNHANAQGFASRVMVELEPINIEVPVAMLNPMQELAPIHKVEEEPKSTRDKVLHKITGGL